MWFAYQDDPLTVVAPVGANADGAAIVFPYDLPPLPPLPPQQPGQQ